MGKIEPRVESQEFGEEGLGIRQDAHSIILSFFSLIIKTK